MKEALNTNNINIDELPSIPQSLVNIIQYFNQDEIEFDQITKLIQQDPSLTTKILDVANSAQYVQFQLKDFKNILVALGLETVKNVTTTAAVHQFFSQFNDDNNNLLGDFWLNALKAAHFAQALASLINYQHIDEAYFAGLIHRIGQLVLITQQQVKYDELISKYHLNNIKIEDEEAIFGITSPQLGSQIVKDWPTSTMLADAIYYQRASVSQLDGADTLIKIINISRLFAELDQTDETKKLTFYQNLYSLFGLNQGVVENLISDIHAKILHAANSLQLKLEDDQKSVIYDPDYSLNLARCVKNISLKGSVEVKTTFNDNNEVIQHLLQNLLLVFGIQRSLYFNYHHNNRELVCRFVNTHVSIDHSLLRVKTDSTTSSAQSLLAKAFQFARIYSSFEQSSETSEQNIVDHQIQRLIQTDGIICIPLLDSKSNSESMRNETNSFGVVVMGINSHQYDKLIDQRKLIGDFTQSAVRHLAHIKKLSQKNSSQTNNNEEGHNQLRLNKLIHEANNPLTIINNYLHILSIKSQKSDLNIGTQIDTLQSEIQRVSDILLQIRSNPDETEKNTKYKIDINQTIIQLINIFQSSLFEFNQVSASVNLSEQLPTLALDESSLRQIIINLVKNAVEELPQGGKIQITTQENIVLEDKSYIEIKVSDNGPGIAPDIQKNLFQPIKTSKGSNNSGLGLNICKNLVEQMSGKISCQSSPESETDYNTSFIIHLPT